SRDRWPVRDVEPHAATELIEALAVDVRVRGVVLEAELVEGPYEIGRAVEPRAAESRDRALESPLEHGAGALDAGRDLHARTLERFPAVFEAVAQDLGTAQLGFGPHEQRAARRAGNQAERGRVPAASDPRQQLLEPGGVRIDARLDVVGEGRGGGVGGR